MAATRLTNVIVPELWNPYTINRSTELSMLWNSGVVAPVSDLSGFVADGGNTINMPFWNDLDGESEIVSASGTALTVNAITSGQDQAVVLARGKAWGVNELAAALSGSDPLTAIGDLVAGWWARDFQRVTLKILEGVFASASMSDNVHDISAVSGGQAITGEGFLDAQQKMGDHKDRLVAVIMHSATENALAKLNLIDYIRMSDAEPRVPYMMGKRVIVDDGMPVSSGTYTTYMFGPGALGYASGSSSKVTEVETDRDSLAGEDLLINRRHFLLHPRGVRYIGAATGGGPANSVLADGASWDRVYNAKDVRIVKFVHKLVNT